MTSSMEAMTVKTLGKKRTVSCAQPDAPNADRNKDSTETQDLTGSRTLLTNLGEEAYHTPTATKIPDRAKDFNITSNKAPLTELPNSMRLLWKLRRSPSRRHRNILDINTPPGMSSVHQEP